MSQYQTIVQDFLQLETLIRTLSALHSAEESIRLCDEIQQKYAVIKDELLNHFIDFEEICDNLPDAIYIADKKGTTVYVNDSYQQMSGVNKKEVLGENVHQINREKKLYSNGVIPSVLKNKKHVETIGTMIRTQTPVYINGFPVFDENGDLKYAVACDRNTDQLEIVKDQLIRLKDSRQLQEDELQYLRTQQLKQSELIFKSPQMYQAVSAALAVAPTDATVLITGESGTGKELIANQIYQAGSRRDKAFLKVNCAAIPDTLMESELFGYEPGSFTGASRKGKTGIFELANHGTLMLDEIGEMPVPMQAKLLRVLQNHEVNRIGGSKPVPVDVRIIAATNRNLLQCVKENTFREDLYYRLNVIPIHLAPLRERREDIEVLADHFLKIFCKKYNKQIEMYSSAFHMLNEYDWPGNTRELENIIERVVVINNTGSIDDKLIARVLGITPGSTMAETEQASNLKAATAALERRMILQALEKYASKRKAAAALGIDHSTLIKKCQRYGI